MNATISTETPNGGCLHPVVGRLCRYCGKPGATVKTLAYWQQTPNVCHPECKAPGERQEAIDCQVIDADCNDCAHFKRGEIIGGIPKAISGHCQKFNRPTTAYPHFWTGRECFEHRRLMPPNGALCHADKPKKI